jgi:hypothetical protein
MRDGIVADRNKSGSAMSSFPVALNNFVLVETQYGAQKLSFMARLIREGDGYGAWLGGDWAMKHKGEPMIEFFDVRYLHTPYGQFTGGRYLLDTFMELGDDRGLCLDGGIPEWSLSAEAVRSVQQWVVRDYSHLVSDDEVTEEVSTLSFSSVLDEISETLAQADGEYLASIYNQLCSGKVRYIEDDVFERLPPEDDAQTYRMTPPQ